jgi:putative oxidoreductase
MSHQGQRLASFLLRITLGVCFCVHGWPKVAQLFGERVPGNWVVTVQSLGLEPAWLFAGLIALGEALAGTAMLLGLFPRLASLTIIAIMVGAICTVQWEKGYSGGWEYNVALIAMAAAVFLTGPGAYAYKLKKHDG